jgi:hypothetical protein
MPQDGCFRIKARLPLLLFVVGRQLRRRLPRMASAKVFWSGKSLAVSTAWYGSPNLTNGDSGVSLSDALRQMPRRTEPRQGPWIGPSSVSGKALHDQLRPFRCLTGIPLLD